MRKKIFAFLIVPAVCLALVGCYVEAGIEDPVYDDHVVVVDDRPTVVVDDRPTVVVDNNDYVVVSEPTEVVVEGDYVYGDDVIDCYTDYDPYYCD